MMIVVAAVVVGIVVAAVSQERSNIAIACTKFQLQQTEIAFTRLPGAWGWAGQGMAGHALQLCLPRVLHFCCCFSFVDYYAKGVNNSYVCPRTCMNIHAHTRTHSHTHTLCA